MAAGGYLRKFFFAPCNVGAENIIFTPNAHFLPIENRFTKQQIQTNKLIDHCINPTAMASPLTNYSVEMEESGLSGWVNYREPFISLRFAYEHFFKSVVIFVPGNDQWAFYCRGAKSRQASDRRTEIMARIADEVRRQHAPEAAVRISDFGIELTY